MFVVRDYQDKEERKMRFKRLNDNKNLLLNEEIFWCVSKLIV